MPHECTDCGREFDDGSKEMLSGCPDCGGTTFQFRPPGADTPADDPPEPPERPDAGVEGVARTVGNAASTVKNLVSSDQPAVGPPEPDGPSDTEAASDGPPDSEFPTDSPPPSSQVSGETSPATEDDIESRSPDRDDSDIIEAPDSADLEDASQRDARRETPDEEELPATPDSPIDRPPVPDPRPISARPGVDDPQEVDRAQDGTADIDEAEPDSSEAEPDSLDEDGERPSLTELREELNDQFESIRVVDKGQYELNLMELYDREEYIIALQEDGKYTIQVPERWDDE